MGLPNLLHVALDEEGRQRVLELTEYLEDFDLEDIAHMITVLEMYNEDS